MMLPEYVKRVQESIYKHGFNPAVCYTSGVSSAMITCYNISCAYMKLRKNKEPPIPIGVINKTSENGESYTCISFSSKDINLSTLNKVISSMGLPNVSVIDYAANINVEIYC